MVIAVTGHRPQKLWGYDLNDKRYKKLKEKMSDFLVARNCTEAICGMALGVDQLFLEVALDLNNQFPDHPIKTVAAIPFEGQETRWRKESIDHYNELLSQVSEKVVVSHGQYVPSMMQRRNEWMVDRADLILAVWNGEHSGTGNCVNYAKKTGKEVVLMSPDYIEGLVKDDEEKEKWIGRYKKNV